MEIQQRLLDILADGRFHSGEEIGNTLGVSRTAVWKHIQAMSNLALDIYAVPGKGYRFSAPLELLSREKIIGYLPSATKALLAELEIFSVIDSTSLYLLGKSAQGLPSGYACLAERQLEGRGRRGRRWVSPYGSNIYLSLLWRFDQGPQVFGALSLAVALAVIRTLAQLGAKNVGVKWPNDIVSEGAKLGGILLDISGEATGPCCAVIGIGLNIRMPTEAASEIEQPWSDLESVLGHQVSRNHVAGILLVHLIDVIVRFQQEGFAPLKTEWRQYDVLEGKRITLHMAENIVEGVSRGIDSSGALLVEHEGEVKRYYSGDVTLRSHP